MCTWTSQVWGLEPRTAWHKVRKIDPGPSHRTVWAAESTGSGCMAVSRKVTWCDLHWEDLSDCCVERNHRRKERIKWVAWTSMVALTMERNRPIQIILWIESRGHAESLGGREWRKGWSRSVTEMGKSRGEADWGWEWKLKRSDLDMLILRSLRNRVITSGSQGIHWALGINGSSQGFDISAYLCPFFFGKSWIGAGT